MSSYCGVYGAGGCGRGIIPLLRSDQRRLCFVDDRLDRQEVNGFPCLSHEKFLADGGSHACIAIADSRIRERLDGVIANAGLELVEARASSVVEMDDVEIGPGALLSPHVTLTSNVRIGRCFHANLYSYVEHDCQIGDFVTFAPRVSCNGNVTIEDHVYVGAGAVIRQNVRIGAGATIGMGAIVTKDVEPGETVVGNPARPMNRAAR